MRNFGEIFQEREHRNILTSSVSWITAYSSVIPTFNNTHVRILLSSSVSACTKSRRYWQYLRKSETSLWGRLIKPAHPRSEADGRRPPWIRRFRWRGKNRIVLQGAFFMTSRVSALRNPMVFRDYWFSDDDWVVLPRIVYLPINNRRTWIKLQVENSLTVSKLIPTSYKKYDNLAIDMKIIKIVYRDGNIIIFNILFARKEIKKK